MALIRQFVTAFIDNPSPTVGAVFYFHDHRFAIVKVNRYLQRFRYLYFILFGLQEEHWIQVYDSRVVIGEIAVAKQWTIALGDKESLFHLLMGKCSLMLKPGDFEKNSLQRATSETINAEDNLLTFSAECYARKKSLVLLTNSEKIEASTMMSISPAHCRVPSLTSRFAV